jgi:decaprenylphospho-beta-D-ribofuranose 2-oxidase
MTGSGAGDVQLSGWGRYPWHASKILDATEPAKVPALQAEFAGLIARGNGRAYGDAAIGEMATLRTRALDRMLAFDGETGLLSVEAGVLLADIIAAFIPRGFFPPVVPGTKFVTVGGMIAADVHGKNHHCDGGFGEHVQHLKLALPDRRIVACSREENSQLFAATIGGMGLTGTIVEATFRMQRVETGWLQSRAVVAPDLAAAIKVLRDTADARYSVGWIDCLARGAAVGRSIIYLAEHASSRDLKNGSERFPPTQDRTISFPCDLPSWVLNRATVATFNDLYFRRNAGRADAKRLVHWNQHFFPLDGVGNWNRMYGRRGFVQHQCVLPSATAPAALGDILERVSHGGTASFLAVLKQLRAGFGTMSFPIEGYTLAIDFPIGRKLFPLLDAIDRIVVSAGGRIYLAKDSRQSRETFEAGYPELGRFRDIRRAIGADRRIASRLSERLGI